MKIKINITPTTNKHWIGADVSMENNTEMQTDEHNIHCCDLLSHCLRKKLGFYRRQLSRIVVYLSKPFWCVCNHYIVVIRFQQPYLPVTHSIPQRYTSLIPLHNPPSPNIYTPLTLSPILQPSLHTQGLPIFTQPLIVVI